MPKSLQGESWPVQLMVNPAGHKFEMITVREAFNLQAVGEPSSMATWFPGYQWTSMVCSGCNAFVGWRFTRDTSAEPASDKRPATFYGLVWAEVVQYHDRKPEHVMQFS